MESSVRWAVNFGNWQPIRSEWLLAGRCIQPEEKARISRFVYKKDAKAAMVIGRLMLRKLINEYLKIEYSQVRLDRTEKGKPFLVNELPAGSSSLNFNLSHNGKYVVLAGEPKFQVGIDVMRANSLGGKTVASFFHTMARQFTRDEWTSILNPGEEMQQLSRFYRFWCLKESYVKAVGVGIGFNIQRLNFAIKSEKIEKGSTKCDTRLAIDEKETSDWIFEETMLDDCHCIAVALGKNPDDDIKVFSKHKPQDFKLLNFSDLVINSSPWQPEDESFWTDFCDRDETPK
uniref:L-aminoadipate-semialdehyde dehydrogenase-phosphopantetheinyl transferase n=1 Tax=Strigamia maritima TaxID=126957 RepID=T1JM81_STRMM